MIFFFVPKCHFLTIWWKNLKVAGVLRKYIWFSIPVHKIKFDHSHSHNTTHTTTPTSPPTPPPPIPTQQHNPPPHPTTPTQPHHHPPHNTHPTPSPTTTHPPSPPHQHLPHQLTTTHPTTSYTTTHPTPPHPLHPTTHHPSTPPWRKSGTLMPDISLAPPHSLPIQQTNILFCVPVHKIEFDPPPQGKNALVFIF